MSLAPRLGAGGGRARSPRCSAAPDGKSARGYGRNVLHDVGCCSATHRPSGFSFGFCLRFDSAERRLPIGRSPCHVASMAECRLHLHLKTAPDRRDSSVLRRETGRKAIVFSLACLLAWGATTFQAQSQGTAPATLSASAVERSF